MAANTVSSNVQTTAHTREAFITGAATSKDGTTIGYRQIGHGPAVMLLHGSAESSLSHKDLAEALADRFTVILPDRRGRGLSGPYSKDYSVQRDVEDIEAVLTKTGAHNVFGVSSGAIILMQAALSLSTIHKLAIFEPPLVIDDSISMSFLSRFDEELAQGKVDDAMVTAMLGAQMGPPIFNSLPRWLLRMMTRMMMANEDKKAKPDDVTMRKLAPTIHYDFQLVNDMKDSLERFRDIRAEVLLLGGSTSRPYLKTAMNAVAKIFPQAKRVEFPDVGHGASGNKDQWGKPDLVAQELRQFFTARV